MANEQRPNKEFIKRANRMNTLKTEIDNEVGSKNPNQQQVFLLTEILKELRMIRENL